MSDVTPGGRGADAGAQSSQLDGDVVDVEGAVTWRQLWNETATIVGDRIHARWMCEHASGCDGHEFVAELDRPAMHGMVAHLDAMVARRRTGEPLQYVLGRWAFRTLDLLVDPRVLIPRPETEWVCEAALTLVRSLPWTIAKPLQIADLGTGSGAFGLSLAAELPRGAAKVWLGDISSDALDVARANLAGCGIAGGLVSIVQGSWFDALPCELLGQLDLVVANPPYVATASGSLEAIVSDWEPHLALFGGDDGLRDIETIVHGAPAWLRPNGWLVLEIGADQGKPVRELLAAHGFNAVEIRSDLAGRDRIAVGRR